jgi:hypothetical protein
VSRHHWSSAELVGRAGALLLLFALAVLMVMPPTVAFGQAGTLTPTPSTATNATTTATSVTAPALTLSPTSALAGAQVTANGRGYRANENVEVTFNGQSVGTPQAGGEGTFALTFTVPDVNPGQYAVLATGKASGFSATSAFTVNQGAAALTFSVPQAPAGTSVTVTGTGFQPGETVQFFYNGASIGTPTADTKGVAQVTFNMPTNIAPGAYDMTATGETSGTTITAKYTLLAASATPAPTTAPAQPTATPVPNQPPATNAPPMAHDERYFSQTGYRIDDDQVWAFFQQYGGTSAFGFPVSRMVTMQGCPVQVFQRHIIQVCPGQGVALINLLDPEWFPYTQVNGSTFPGPDPTLKNSTPQVGTPTYATDIVDFINANVPDSFNGAPVNFLQTFNALGGLTIWGAPISKPAPEPTNANFIYQRFQRGIMHFIAGQGTQSILLADYLKSIITNQNVPPDLLAQSRESKWFNQYCPGQAGWLCRPADLPATDLTFAFVQG